MTYELRSYSVGEAIGKGFSVFIEGIWRYLLAGLLFALPLTFINVVMLSGVNGTGATATDLLITAAKILGGSFVSMIFTYLASAYFVQRVAGLFLGLGRKAPHEELSSALRVVPTVLATSILSTLATGLGFILLVVPGILLFLGLQFTTSCTVLEGLGPVASMKRSWALAKGRKGRLFLLVLVEAITSFLLGLGIGALGGYLLGLAGVPSRISVFVCTTLTSMIFLPLQAAIDVVYYLGVRVDAEALDVERLAADFGSGKPEVAAL